MPFMHGKDVQGLLEDSPSEASSTPLLPDLRANSDISIGRKHRQIRGDQALSSLTTFTIPLRARQTALWCP